MKRPHDRNPNQIPNRRCISRHNREAGDPLAEITHKAEISHNAAPNYHLTKEAPRCPERPRTPPRPLFALGASTHAARQSQCLRPAPPGPKHTLDSPSTHANPTCKLLGGFAGRISPKRHPAPAFPQVGGSEREQPPPETAQESRGRARGRSRGSR